MKVFIINLQRSTQRRINLEKQISNLPPPHKRKIRI